MSTYLLIFITTLCTIGSQLLLKRSIDDVAAVLKQSGVAGFLLAATTSPGVLAALAIQCLGYVVWWFVLTRAQLSVAFAISSSFFYLLMAAAGWIFFNERLTLLQWGGLVLISAGVLLVTLGSAK